MSISRTLCLAISAILIPGGAVTAATVTYDGGTTSRPLSVVGIGINSSFYDVTFTYNNNGDTNPLRVGSLPDTDIALGRAGLLSLLNTQSVDSNSTFIVFQPNVDTTTIPTGQYQSNGYLAEYTAGMDTWENSTFITTITGSVSAAASYGFAQFTVSEVPEPSAIAGCLGLVGMGLIGWRRKSNRKKK
jgi:hypothetical protein